MLNFRFKQNRSYASLANAGQRLHNNCSDLLLIFFKDNKTPLHKASENGKIDVCETLLKAGADVEATDSVRFDFRSHLTLQNLN